MYNTFKALNLAIVVLDQRQPIVVGFIFLLTAILKILIVQVNMAGKKISKNCYHFILLAFSDTVFSIHFLTFSIRTQQQRDKPQTNSLFGMHKLVQLS